MTCLPWACYFGAVLFMFLEPVVHLGVVHIDRPSERIDSEGVKWYSMTRVYERTGLERCTIRCLVQALRVTEWWIHWIYLSLSMQETVAIGTEVLLPSVTEWNMIWS